MLPSPKLLFTRQEEEEEGEGKEKKKTPNQNPTPNKKPNFGKLYLFFITSFSLALVSPSLFYKRWLEIEIYWFPNEKIHSI